MKITDLIKQKAPFFSIEITPPIKTKSIQPIFNTIERLLPYNPAFVNITYHPLKISTIKLDDKDVEVISQKHASQVGLCSAIKYKYNVEVVPHLVCAGFNKIQVEDILFDLMFLGIENILALRGDAKTANDTFQPVDGGYKYANELITQIKAMKKSRFIHKEYKTEPLDFCIGAAGYPQKHFEAKNIAEDISNLKRKIDCGAEFIITQICYDIENFSDWLNKCRQAGIHVPIIPGLKPLTSDKQIDTLKETYHINIPKKLEQDIKAAKTKEEKWEIGINHSISYSKELLQAGAAGIHYFTMGKGKDVEDIVKQIF